MTTPIFIFCALRGGFDGLDVVIPRGDPEFNKFRKRFPFTGERDLDGFFSLHGRLDVLHNLAMAGEASFVHAVATTSYDRSHFEGQRVLQSGGTTPYEVKTGWLNRLLQFLRSKGIDTRGAAVPGGSLATSGPASFPAFGETVSKIAESSRAQLATLWGRDEILGKTYEQMLAQDAMTTKLTLPERMAELGKLGHSVLYTEFGGFDTHTNQSWPLAGAIDRVDEYIGQLKAAFGADWDRVIFMAASEFGRGFYPNSSAGTDHGIANVVILAGGKIKEWTFPKVIADWPGLTKEKLFQGRDLMPTKDMRSVMLAVVCRLFHLQPKEAAAVIFPTAAGLKPDAAVFEDAVMDTPPPMPPTDEPMPPMPPEEPMPPMMDGDIAMVYRGGRDLFEASRISGTVADLDPATPVIFVVDSN
jgi:uncharacterized protein (DUF1501 family)